MPELPEVETIKNELINAKLVGKKIKNVDVFNFSTIAKYDPVKFINKLEGCSILSINRKGKFIHFELNEEHLFIHLRMTGKFLISSKAINPGKHERVRITFEDGTRLCYHDTRKFGRWYLVKEENMITSSIGIEPLSSEFTLFYFKQLLKGKKTRLKPFLLDQKKIAGLGNIYVDEALWEAKLHPETTINHLTLKQITALHQAIIKVLQKGIEHRGTSLGTGKTNYYDTSGERGGNQYHLNVFRRQGKDCSVCGNKIERIVVAQRGTHICSHCQKKY